MKQTQNTGNMTRVQTIEDAATKVRELINGVVRSQYFILEIEDKTYQIRVSDHSANRNNNEAHDYDGYFSFVLNTVIHQGYGSSNMMNEWVIDENGEFTEEFTSVEDCLDWNIN